MLPDTSVIVTGGSQGIGAHCVREFLASGASVTIADLNAPSESLAASDRVHFVATDVADEQSTAAMAAAAIGRFGRVDVLVNNAGVYNDIGRRRPFDEITPAQWDRMMAINVKGAWLCAKAVAPTMRAQGYGRIVNISSTAVYIGSPGFAHYIASKAAVVGLTHALARELGFHGVTVNAVAPGLLADVNTEALNGSAYLDQAKGSRAIARQMESGDLIGAVKFLASADSAFITGQELIVDGGHIFR